MSDSQKIAPAAKDIIDSHFTVDIEGREFVLTLREASLLQKYLNSVFRIELTDRLSVSVPSYWDNVSVLSRPYETDMKIKGINDTE